MAISRVMSLKHRSILEFPLGSYKKYNDEFWCEVAKHAVSRGTRLTVFPSLQFADL